MAARTRMRARTSAGVRSSTSISSWFTRTSPHPVRLEGASDVEEEVDHVAVLNDVLFAFSAQLAKLARLVQTAGANQVVIADNLGSDETTLNVGVNLGGCLDCRGASPNRPGPALIWSDGEERDQPQQFERATDDMIESRLCDAEVAHERGRVVWLQVSDLHLDLSRQRGNSDSRALEPRSRCGYKGGCRLPELVLTQIQQNK